MRGGLTQTRKRRVELVRAEKARWLGRYLTGKTLTLGEDHEGYYTNGQHAALRWLPIVWLGLLIFLLIERAWFVVDVLLIWTVGMCVALPIVWLVRRIRGWWQFRGLLEPLSKTLGDVVGWPRNVRPWLWLHFPLGWEKNPNATVKIDLRYDSANEETKRKKILEALSAGLGRKLDPRYITWKTDVRPSPLPWRIMWPYLTIRPDYPPPDKVLFVDNIAAIERYRKPSVIPLGVGLYNEVETIDIDDDAPHAVIAADSGRGKSSIEALIGSVLCHKGAVMMVLDPKRVSLRAFKGLPNVVYCAGPEETNEGLLALKAELARRADLLDVDWGEVPPSMGSRIVVLIEEADSLVDDLRNWKEDKGEGRSNVRSIGAMNRLRNMGRELEINIFVVTQTGGAAALGGAGSQTGFGFQLISVNHRGVWTKLAPQVKEPPTQSKHRGRWHLNKPGSGDTPVEIQTFGWTDPPEGEKHKKFSEAREYAASGKIGVIPELLRGVAGLPDGRTDGPTEVVNLANEVGLRPRTHEPTSRTTSGGYRLVSVGGALTEQPAESILSRIARGVYADQEPATGELLTVKEAIERGVLHISASGFRSARSAGTAPEPVPGMTREGTSPPAKLYRRSDLERFDQRKAHSHG